MEQLTTEQNTAERAGDIGRAAELGRQIAEQKRRFHEMDRLRVEPHE